MGNQSSTQKRSPTQLVNVFVLGQSGSQTGSHPLTIRRPSCCMWRRPLNATYSPVRRNNFAQATTFLAAFTFRIPRNGPPVLSRHSIRLRDPRSGSSSTSAIRMQARSRLREAWSSQGHQTATSSYLTRTLGRTFGTFNLVRPYIQRRSLIVLMVGSTSLFRRALRFLPLHSQKHECHGTAFVETLSVTSVSIH